MFGDVELGPKVESDVMALAAESTLDLTSSVARCLVQGRVFKRLLIDDFWVGKQPPFTIVDPLFFIFNEDFKQWWQWTDVFFFSNRDFLAHGKFFIFHEDFDHELLQTPPSNQDPIGISLRGFKVGYLDTLNVGPQP